MLEITIIVLAAIYLPLFIGLGANLFRIAQYMEAQNKHYGIGINPPDSK